MAEPYVFLSYASADREQALRLSERLEIAGVAVWLDRQAIAGGKAWDTEIVRGIGGCTALVLLATEAALRSPNVQQELRLAWEERRPVVPLHLERVAYPEDVRYILAGRQWVEAHDQPDEAWLARLVEALSAIGIASKRRATAAESTEAASPTAPPVHLPTPLSSFVGREREVGELAALLPASRLLTLLGPGGTGKTRLAIEVARAAAPAFPDGVHFIPLAAISDPALVLPTLAQALGVREAQGVPLAKTLAASFRDKQTLLILDNLEQVVEAAPRLAALLEACLRLTVLVTSRVALRLSGEREYAVAPLPLPAGARPSLADLAASPAVALFVQRAAESRPGFALNEANAPAVAAICARLDGLPLALELAAARVKILTPQALLSRLDTPLKLLSGGNRNLPERQQTLRATIKWSYDLLSRAEQTVFRRLAVFVGGCTLEAAEAVCWANGDLDLDVLDGVTSLVEKSLLRQDAGDEREPRFSMLVTVREFAREQLAVSGEESALWHHHGERLLGLAHEARQWLGRGAEGVGWRSRLAAEIDNLRAALTWHTSPGGDAALAASLAVDLAPFWELRGGFTEARGWLRQVLNHAQALAPTQRATLLNAKAMFAIRQGDPAVAQTLGSEALALFRHAGDTRGVFAALFNLDLAAQGLDQPVLRREYCEEVLSLAREVGDPGMIAGAMLRLGVTALDGAQFAEARPLLEEALARFRALDERINLGWVHLQLSRLTWGEGDRAAARNLAEEGLAAWREVGYSTGIPIALGHLGESARLEGDRQQAAVLIEQSVSMARRLGMGPVVSAGLFNRGWILLGDGDYELALACFTEALTLIRAIGTRVAMKLVLIGFSAAAAERGQPTLAARLLGAASEVRITGPILAWGSAGEFDWQAAIRRVRSHLHDDAFAVAWEEGRKLSLDEAVSLALGPLGHEPTTARAEW